MIDAPKVFFTGSNQEDTSLYQKMEEAGLLVALEKGPIQYTFLSIALEKEPNPATLDAYADLVWKDALMGAGVAYDPAETVRSDHAVGEAAGVPVDTITRVVKNFKAVEHRIEFVNTVNGVDYYNDSKGTNVDAAVIAIKALKDGIILIAGGDGKGQDFEDLVNHFEGAVEALILLGRDAPIIEEAARKAGFTNIYNCKDMPECVRKAAELARAGEKVLLSPACASWDMYANFEQRGRHFKQCINEMLK